jgi:hypothetical protein
VEIRDVLDRAAAGPVELGTYTVAELAVVGLVLSDTDPEPTPDQVATARTDLVARGIVTDQGTPDPQEGLGVWQQLNGRTRDVLTCRFGRLDGSDLVRLNVHTLGEDTSPALCWQSVPGGYAVTVGPLAVAIDRVADLAFTASGATVATQLVLIRPRRRRRKVVRDVVEVRLEQDGSGPARVQERHSRTSRSLGQLAPAADREGLVGWLTTALTVEW